MADKVKIEPVRMVWDYMNWICSAQDRQERRAVACTVVNPRVPQNTEKF